MDAVYKALSDPTRRRIIVLLRSRPMKAGDIAVNFSLSKPTLSQHFLVLREANLVMSVRRGTTITYHLNFATLDRALESFVNDLGMKTTYGSSTPEFLEEAAHDTRYVGLSRPS